jgi:hypothetical protein
MAVTTSSPRRFAPMLAVVLLVLLVLGVLVGCSSSDDGAAPGDSTTPTSAASGTSVSSGDTVDTTAGPGPSSPSTIPASVDTACAALAETLGLDTLQPQNTSSWVDERQRIVVDAQREAQLLAAAQDGPPSDVVDSLATTSAYATWLATPVGAADSFSTAVSAIDRYPEMVRVSLAVATVRTWRAANCPE